MRNELAVSTLMLAMIPAFAGTIPSRFGVDAPELAPLGRYGVGLRVLHLVQPEQPDVAAFDAVSATAPRRDRVLTVDLWYPARPEPHAPRAIYAARLPAEPPAAPVRFTVPGIAVRNAAPAAAPAPATAAGRPAPAFPLVIVSHGYSNDPAAMTWLTENLASKGYVVAAIRHDDPPITDRARFPEVLLRRPLDLAFVAAALRRSLADEHLIDPSRLALIGYSIGGYGVLTAAGATLDPEGAPARSVPGGLMLPFVRGAPREQDVRIDGVRAVIAISPAGGGTLGAWGAEGARGITAPLLLIAGDADRTVDYASGARALFDQSVNARRYLLTFRGAGHSIGLSPAPRAMRRRLWDQDWFEDPVWRKERLNAIEMHFITAFLGIHLAGDPAFASYLDVPVASSSTGVWPADAPPAAYDGFSNGAAPVTVWKGFQRKHAEGLELLRSEPAS